MGELCVMREGTQEEPENRSIETYTLFYYVKYVSFTIKKKNSLCISRISSLQKDEISELFNS